MRALVALAWQLKSGFLERFLVGFEVDYVVAKFVHVLFLLSNFANILLDHFLKFGLVIIKRLFVIAVFVVEVAQLNSVALKFVLLKALNFLLLLGEVPIIKQHVALVTHALWFRIRNANLSFLVRAWLANFLPAALAEPNFWFEVNEWFKAVFADVAVFRFGVTPVS